ncbi:DUF1396 domain-containing protein [Streptomyces sp. NPDC007088]|uniref:DUF1396 domain-containing protein n=1 Tax=Streptomyces sp. NPDC007088 TaxID=3364773 RepID=UPI003676ACD8
MGITVGTARGRAGRIAGAVLATALLGGAAVGCSGSEDKADAEPAAAASKKAAGASPAAAIKDAAARSRELTSFTYRMEGTTPGAGKMSAKAAMSTKPLAARMTMEMASAKAEGTEIRLVGGDMYIDGGAAMAKETGGKRWISLPVGELDKAAAAEPSAAWANKNPAQDSTFLTASDDLRKVGPQTVEGVETTHYRGTVSLDELSAEAKKDPATAKQREAAVKQYRDLGVEKMTMDVYLDGEGRTKRFRTTAKTAQGPLDQIVTFGDYNKPVTVEKPPAKDLTSLEDMLGGLGDLSPEEQAKLAEELGKG